MDKMFYVTPYVETIELNAEGVLCASQTDGLIDQLNGKYDWSDELMWE